MRFQPRHLYRRALEAARDALARMEPDRVPQPLQVVARGELTPPRQIRLLEAIDEHTWLREKALEQWSDAGKALEGGAEEASALLLVRPPGWELRLAEFGWKAGAAAGVRQAEGADQKRAASEERAVVMKRELTAARKKLADAEARERALRREAGAPVRAERKGEEALKAEILAVQQRAAKDGDRLRAEIAALVDANDQARTALDRERRLRREAEERIEPPEILPGLGMAGLELARRLDLMEMAAGVGDRGEPPHGVATHPVEAPPSLPAGVGPEEAEAVAAVLSHRPRIHLVLDGYNLGFALIEDGTEPDLPLMRRRVELVARRLQSAAGRRHVTIVFDSPSEASEHEAVPGVTIRFTEPGVTADEEIVAMAAPGVVVVSNDRAVREAAAERGALTLYSTAVANWERERR